jgi:hypothetical protein
MRESHRVTRVRIAQRAERRLNKADRDAKAGVAVEAQRAIREKLSAEIKAKIAARAAALEGVA